MSDVYAAVEAIARDAPGATANICEVLGVSRSAYYSWLAAEPGVRECELGDLTPSIVAVFWRHRRRYGARRIAQELKGRLELGDRSADRLSFVHVFDNQPFAELRPHEKSVMTSG